MMSGRLTDTATRLVVALALVLVAGCTSVHRHPVPLDDMDRAIVPGLPDVRDWGDEPSPRFQQDLVESVRDSWGARGASPGDWPVHALVLSGGGANGAFGAGFLNGWSETGNRPTFKLVTGISIGALIAPFAFLGPEYDSVLEEVFTAVTSKDVYKIRSPFSVFKKDSLARTDPLALRLEELIDEEVLEAVASEHRRGRRLFIGTTNLDAQRFVVWNMGAIADSGQPGSLELFRSILLASSSIPVAFPPVYIEVEVDGRRYDEMHVDGGVFAELFLLGAMVDITDARRELEVEGGPSSQPTIYIIRNGQIDAAAEQVEPRLIGIASRSIGTLLKAVAMGDLARIRAQAEAAGIDYNYVAIPPEHSEAPAGKFAPSAMRRLFDLGRAMAKELEPWHNEPPAWVR